MGNISKFERKRRLRKSQYFKITRIQKRIYKEIYKPSNNVFAKGISNELTSNFNRLSALDKTIRGKRWNKLSVKEQIKIRNEYKQLASGINLKGTRNLQQRKALTKLRTLELLEKRVNEVLGPEIEELVRAYQEAEDTGDYEAHEEIALRLSKISKNRNFILKQIKYELRKKDVSLHRMNLKEKAIKKRIGINLEIEVLNYKIPRFSTNPNLRSRDNKILGKQFARGNIILKKPFIKGETNLITTRFNNDNIIKLKTNVEISLSATKTYNNSTRHTAFLRNNVRNLKISTMNFGKALLKDPYILADKNKLLEVKNLLKLLRGK